MRRSIAPWCAIIATLMLATGCSLFDTDDGDDGGTNEPTHGIVDFYSVEGVVPDVSTNDEVVTLLGSPAYSNEISTHYYYYYPSMGLKFAINSTTNVVAGAYIYGKGWTFSVSGHTGTFSQYAYSTEQGIYLDSSSTMDDVLQAYGTPARRLTLGNADTTGIYPRYFKYTADVNSKTGNMEFYFWGTDTTDYAGKKIIQISLY